MFSDYFDVKDKIENKKEWCSNKLAFIKSSDQDIMVGVTFQKDPDAINKTNPNHLHNAMHSDDMLHTFIRMRGGQICI